MEKSLIIVGNQCKFQQRILNPDESTSYSRTSGIYMKYKGMLASILALSSAVLTILLDPFRATHPPSYFVLSEASFGGAFILI
jgi:hypothetical protein